jgi:hypothetical protein
MYPQICGQIGGQVNGIKLETAYMCGFSFKQRCLLNDGFYFLECQRNHNERKNYLYPHAIAL